MPRRLANTHPRRPGANAASDREHLLLATRERPGELLAAFGKHGKQRQDPVDVAMPLDTAACRVRPHFEVLQHGH
jgi:hypothetical protein